jgi:5-methylcytosine-specific restriction protein B
VSTEGEIVAERLRLRARELADKGDLLSAEKLKEFYGNFAEHFGPRQLQSLDGERLLNTMHDVTDKNALPYWLEFKNDDEFRTLKFGSIAGGSALKFGIFKKKEIGAWTTGSPANQVQVSTDAAIDIARKHRNQLLEVCKLLDDLTDDASDPVYARLQSAIETKAADLCDLAWAHKYFSLLYPKRLDDYHNENYGRFHLIRALQLPPEVKGRYVCAGRFVELARAAGLPIVSLTAVMNSFAHTPYHNWRIGTREGDDGTSFWQQMRDGSYVSVGWPKLGDLGWLVSEDPQQRVDKLRPVLAERYPNAANVVTREAKELVNFL